MEPLDLVGLHPVRLENEEYSPYAMPQKPLPDVFKASNMTPVINTVGVVGTGVIGASWTAFFLHMVLKSFVCDPAAYIKSVWPSLEQLGLHPDARFLRATNLRERA